MKQRQIEREQADLEEYYQYCAEIEAAEIEKSKARKQNDINVKKELDQQTQDIMTRKG